MFKQTKNLNNQIMKFLSLVKNLKNRIDYYDKISPLPFDKTMQTNPFVPKKNITMIWIENEKKNF